MNAILNMNKIIIGSSAIKYWFNDFKREPKDLDYAVDEMHILKNSKNIEYLYNPVLFKPEYQIYHKDGYLVQSALYTLKISHVFWDLENNSWDKHIWDIQFLKEKGCKIILPLFYKLYDYWNEVHGKNKRSVLNMSAEKFFDNVVGFPVEHDYLHTLLIQHPYFKGQELPTYTKILKDGAEVDVSEEKFNLLTEQEKFNLVFEEVAVMGIERYGEMYYKKGYNRMLKKFILNHAPVWEAIWIVMNHKELSNCPFDFLTFLNNKIKQNESTVN